MEIKFTKMHGCGNDYVYVNCFKHNITNPDEVAKKVSDRHFGVGGDGLILVCPPEDPNNDGKMRMYNADGSEGKMCGNGIRCVAKFLYDNKIAQKDILRIETLSGVKTVEVFAKDGAAVTCSVEMGLPIFDWQQIPLSADAGGKLINYHFKDFGADIFCLSMGNPHCVIVKENIDFDISILGKEIEKNALFPESVNTEFVHLINETTIEMRVWERGSGETLACGTGTCAAVVALTEMGKLPKGREISVKVPGGELFVLYNDKNVFLRGEAVKVFDGVIDI